MVIDSLEIIYDHNILDTQKIKNWVTYQIIITRLRFQDTIKKIYYKRNGLQYM